MAIELPSKPDILDEPLPLDERLASLEDPLLTERLFRENPALFAQEPPRTQREILAWTTRRFGTALLAVTAAVSIAAGYLGFERTRGNATAPQTTPHAAALPLRQSAAPAQRRTTAHPTSPAHTAVAAPRVQPAEHAAGAPLRRVASLPVQHRASAPVLQRHANSPAVAYQPAVRPATHAAPAHRSAPAHHAAQAPAAQTAAGQLAAWEATHPASAARSRSATASEPAPQTRPRSEPATATETGPASSTEPVTTTTTGGAPESSRTGGVKTPPTNPGGVWTERIPGGGTLGGGMGPVIGVPRDSCTPRGGRTGIVMEAISVLMSSRR